VFSVLITEMHYVSSSPASELKLYERIRKLPTMSAGVVCRHLLLWKTILHAAHTNAGRLVITNTQ